MANRRLSEEEVKQISLRMKSARMLTGLSQDLFATENSIPLMSLKCWESGRALPRKEGIQNYLNAIKKRGVDVKLEWIFEGCGPGPTYINGTQVEKPKLDSNYIEQQIDLFKKHQLSKGLNPIVTRVKDDEMLPYFKCGDLVGGYYVTVNKITSELPLNEILKKSWLLMLPKEEIVPRFLVIGENEEPVFYRSNFDPIIRIYPNSLIGYTCWHYFDVEHTYME